MNIKMVGLQINECADEVGWEGGGRLLPLEARLPGPAQQSGGQLSILGYTTHIYFGEVPFALF